jgi:hypothetical protein
MMRAEKMIVARMVVAMIIPAEVVFMTNPFVTHTPGRAGRSRLKYFLNLPNKIRETRELYGKGSRQKTKRHTRLWRVAFLTLPLGLIRPPPLKTAGTFVS